MAETPLVTSSAWEVVDREMRKAGAAEATWLYLLPSPS